MIIGERLKEARNKKGLTQSQLGELLGVSKVSICGYEKGTRTPTMDKFLLLIQILDLDVQYVLGLEIKVVDVKDTSYIKQMAKKDIEIIEVIKTSRELYNMLCTDTKRTVERIKSKLNIKDRK